MYIRHNVVVLSWW